jgi:hypothetical protein
MSIRKAHRLRSIVSRRIGLVAAVLIVLSSTALACGGDDEVTGPRSTPVATAPATTTATTPAPAATAPATGPVATTGVPPSGGSSGGTTAPAESQPGGAGDEEAIRVPAAFTIAGGTTTPRTVSVPAFLAIELRLTSRDRQRHVVRVANTETELAAGATAVAEMDGLKRGDYPLLVDGRRAGTLRVGAEPGP